jgi:hypothetical protein
MRGGIAERLGVAGETTDKGARRARVTDGEGGACIGCWSVDAGTHGGFRDVEASAPDPVLSLTDDAGDRFEYGER